MMQPLCLIEELDCEGRHDRGMRLIEGILPAHLQRGGKTWSRWKRAFWS